MSFEEYQNYDITIRKSDISGMYQLSTMAESMGQEYRESMISNTNPMKDKNIVEKFIKMVESHK